MIRAVSRTTLVPWPKLAAARARAVAGAALAVPAGFARDPRTVSWLLGRLPFVQRGYDFARRWRGEATGRPAAPVEAGRANALRSFFEARATGRGITKWRHYFDAYDRHLAKFVGRDVTILEVGIYSGGSLEMWRSYFGPRCRVVGIDIQDSCRVYENEATRIFIGDQADRSFWRRLLAEIPAVDVVIDDGGHAAEQQIVTLEETLPALAPGGVFICEDTHGDFDRFISYVHGLVSSLNAFEPDASDLEFLRDGKGIASHPTPFQRDIHAVHSYPYLTVIEKRDAPLEHLVCPKHGTEWQPFRA
jgi:23S rRNA U2552 (ribose-2'-O)-methylase RlmE/FtsJ